MELQCLWIPWSCGVPGLHVRSPVSGRVCVLPQSAIVTLLSFIWVGLLLALVRGPLPQADAVGFGLRWSGRLSSLLTGRSCSLDLGSSSLDLVGGGGFQRVPSGCGHPLGSIVSFVTIDRERRICGGATYIALHRTWLVSANLPCAVGAQVGVSYFYCATFRTYSWRSFCQFHWLMRVPDSSFP